MKLLKVAVASLFAFLLFFGIGTLMLRHGFSILDAGELSYQHGGRRVTVSPETHAFSYYYQVAFFATIAGFMLLLGAATCMYALAKVIRSVRSEHSLLAARVYHGATLLAWSGLGLAAVWVVLRALRSMLIE